MAIFQVAQIIFLPTLPPELHKNMSNKVLKAKCCLSDDLDFNHLTSDLLTSSINYSFQLDILCAEVCNDLPIQIKSNQIKSNYFIVRLKVDQRAGQLSLPSEDDYMYNAALTASIIFYMFGNRGDQTSNLIFLKPTVPQDDGSNSATLHQLQ